MQLARGNRAQPSQEFRHPERDLMAAMLDRAIWDAAGAYEAEPHQVKQARYWIEHGRFGAITFEQCCGYLGIDPAPVQRRMAQILSSHSERMALLSRRERQNYRGHE